MNSGWRGSIIAIAGAFAIVLTAACSRIARFKEFENPQMQGAEFDSLAVIAGSTDQSTLQMASKARTQIEDAELVKIISVRGLWETEAEALRGICEDYGVNGVVTVEWNRVTLRSCRSESVAFDVEGGLAGVDRMINRLIEYLRP